MAENTSLSMSNMFSSPMMRLLNTKLVFFLILQFIAEMAAITTNAQGSLQYAEFFGMVYFNHVVVQVLAFGEPSKLTSKQAGILHITTNSS